MATLDNGLWIVIPILIIVFMTFLFCVCRFTVLGKKDQPKGRNHTTPRRRNVRHQTPEEYMYTDPRLSGLLTTNAESRDTNSRPTTELQQVVIPRDTAQEEDTQSLISEPLPSYQERDRGGERLPGYRR
ncbi:hypothetical protein BCR43DRAFT_504416 [Syncephalastrum racemosum]|uniref:Uncharacterized protein n=1 Tax=Syncephalastrum racemosum TaxID=13706 RepID=A0A1X2HF03_SYNRA|nr:hypothetical protein BCR43DRAFT_504416 [Syncephalastrum racemosum]